MFCAKHCMEHRQELCNRFEQVMTEYNDILQQIQDKQPQNESLKKDLFDRVDQWENSMIEKVHETGEQIRQQLTELINNENILVSNNIQALTDEIRKRHEKEDFLEDDIERIRTSINQVQLEIDKRTEPSNIKLYVEPDPQISLEHLIYVEDKPLRTSFSVINKQSTDKNSNDTEIVPHPDVWQPSNQYPPVPQYIPQYSVSSSKAMKVSFLLSLSLFF
jgi:predicted  nucleic acid-binding Zn-ribbon protein